MIHLMKYINLILYILLSIFFSSNSFPNEKIISELKKGGNIIVANNEKNKKQMIKLLKPAI